MKSYNFGAKKTQKIGGIGIIRRLKLVALFRHINMNISDRFGRHITCQEPHIIS